MNLWIQHIGLPGQIACPQGPYSQSGRVNPVLHDKGPLEIGLTLFVNTGPDCRELNIYIYREGGC